MELSDNEQTTDARVQVFSVSHKMSPWTKENPHYGAFHKVHQRDPHDLDLQRDPHDLDLQRDPLDCDHGEIYSSTHLGVEGQVGVEGQNCCYADPVSNRGRFLQMFRAIALMLIPLMALVSLACYWMVTNVIVKSDLENDKVMVNRGQTVGKYNI
ncbi:uncharacterized protein LOC131944021 [Physella acuta]|uniref:uncharacterized protein LOC131944021 n=1 Tax=Physella acuta TaxID=109671 RepID=UPI0027DDE2DE|nr:uncharacterized protein LOC131944021 [Physella acuta]